MASDRMKAEVLAALKDYPMTPRQVWAELDQWAVTSVKQTILELYAEGRCLRSGDESGYRYAALTGEGTSRVNLRG